MVRLAMGALACALVAPTLEASRIRRVNVSEAQSEVEVVSIPMRVYKKDCWKRPKRYGRKVSLAEYPGAGLDLKGPFEEVFKDGFYPVDCLKDYMYEFGDKHGNNKDQYNQDKISNVSIVNYKDVVPRENREKMTHDICFKFCRTIPEMYFFGIKNGNDCYCAPYYKAMAGDSDVCDVVCEGDQTKMCGSKTKSSIFEMHLCAKTGKNLADASATMADSADTLTGLDSEVTEIAEFMDASAADLQAMFSQRDPVASNQMQETKVFVGKLLEASTKAKTLLEEMTELGDKATGMDAYTFTTPEELEEGEDLTAEIKTAITASTAMSQEIEALIAQAAPKLKYNETTPGVQYRTVLHFVDQKLGNVTSTCGGTTVSTPKVGSFDACAEACDVEVGECIGFNYFALDEKQGLCILLSKLKSAMYFAGCKAEEEFLQRKVNKTRYDGDPLKTQCVVKLAEFEGTTLKPDPSGKCKQCLKEFEEAKKCYTEYA